VPVPASILNASQAEQFVRSVFGNRSDYLKIVANDGPDQDTQNAWLHMLKAEPL
jgi:hypothetical protein